jgi:maltooligosyltrehalose trehalohydrolase
MVETADKPADNRLGAGVVGPRGVRWRVWAPFAASVRLVTWCGSQRRERPMDAEPRGYFSLQDNDVADLAELRYAFRLPECDFDLPDPASRRQPEGVHRPSALFDPGRFQWSDRAWPGVRSGDLAIYELHVGTFTPEGTFDAAVGRLPDLVELGVTAVELMPVAQFPGTRNWGYDGVHPFAVQNTYGGPDGLQRFVDAAHGLGLAVLLDVVYNHLGPEGNYLGRFGPYFTAQHHTPWGDAINLDGPDSDSVREFFLENARRWITDFHLDGLRLDAVHAIFDLGARHFLAEVQETVQRAAADCGRTAVVIAESNQNDVRLVRSPEAGGYGLDGVWSDDFHHAVHARLTGDRHDYYLDFGKTEQIVKALNDVFVYDGGYSPFRRRRHGSRVGDLPRERFVVALQNHDQIGNRFRGERLSTLASPQALRGAVALLLLSPCTPLLFMGEEYGETRPFPFFSSFEDPQLIEAVRRGRRLEFAEAAALAGGEPPDPQAQATFASAVLEWKWPAGSAAAGLRRLYRTLLAARRTWPALVDRRHTSAAAAPDRPQLLMLRRGAEPTITAWWNLAAEPVPLRAELPPGQEIVLSTAEARFGGGRRALDAVDELQPYELIVAGGPECRTPSC